MTAKLLTAAAVARLRPGPQRVEIRDAGCPGLILIIQPSGVKSWAMRFRRSGGRLMRMTLGPVDQTGTADAPRIGVPLTLAGARKLAAEVQHQRALGIDLGREPGWSERRRAP